MSVQEPSIVPLVLMPQQARVREPDEDWTGIIDPTERRRLQNRLNQRAQRLRARRKIKSRPTSLQLSQTAGSQAVLQPVVSQPVKPIRKNDLLSVLEKNYKLTPPGAVEDISGFETRALQSYRQGLPNTDHLITLSKLNIQRAVTDNIAAMGMTIDWVKDNIDETIPQSLRPTSIQRTTRHHPWFDVLPFPKLRDNLIQARGFFNERELCQDLMAGWDTRNTAAMLLVWGQPWDPMNWEATELFLRKWGWILHGSSDLRQSTNRWREKRGEEALPMPPF